MMRFKTMSLSALAAQSKNTNLLVTTKIRSSHRRCSVKKGVPKNLANFTGIHICCSPFLIKLQSFRPATLLKKDSNTGVSLWNLLFF